MKKFMKQKQVKIVTYCSWSSLGSILQSFALSRTISSFGYRNIILHEEWNRTVGKHRPKGFREFLKFAYKSIWERKRKRAYCNRMQFIDANMKTEYFLHYNDLLHVNRERENDVYLVGSDQVWHPDLCNPLFFLDFVKNAPRISYAASMGKTEIKPEKEEIFGNMIRNFDHISVREHNCVDVIRRFTNKEIFVHIDPTFLIDSDTWRKMEIPRNIKTPYILLYMLYWDKSYQIKIKELRKKTGLPVYSICSDVPRGYADKYLLDVGVEEFLWLIDHAAYVITSSFHGVAFSIIFNKKFSAIVNPALPSRIENILNVLSAPCIGIDELDREGAFDYSVVNKRISEERDRSIEYLKGAIG